MCAPSPPGVKKATAAAEAQGQANVDAAVAQGHINNPNYVGPQGTQTVTWGANNQPTVTQTYSPDQQRLYDTSNAVKEALGKLGLQGTDALKGLIGNRLDLSGAPAAPGDAASTRKSVIDAMMSRYDEDASKRQSDANSELIARGLRPGTEAYEREMNRFGQQRNDYMRTAETAAGGEASRDFQMDSERRRAAIAEILSQRQTPLNEITALTSGSQVSNPFQVGNFNGNSSVAPAPMTLPFQAQMDRYNASAANYGNMMSGLFGLGSAGIGAWG